MRWRLKSLATWRFVWQFTAAYNSEISQPYIIGPLWGDSTGAPWFHSQRVINADNVPVALAWCTYDTVRKMEQAYIKWKEFIHSDIPLWQYRQYWASIH